MKRMDENNPIAATADTNLETLANTDLRYHLLELASLLEGRAVHDLPVVKDGLREGLALSVRTKVGGETE